MLTRERKIQILDIIIAGFEEQKVSSYNKDSGLCFYRDGDGNKCAIGMLIPDEIYDPEIECNSMKILFEAGKTYRTSLAKARDVLFEYLQINKDDMNEKSFYTCLQEIHDNSAWEFEEMLNKYKQFKQTIIEEIE